MLVSTRYYKDIDFEKSLKSKNALEALQNIKCRESAITKKPSIGKVLVIQLLLQKYTSSIENRIFMQMYNSIIAPRIKVINHKGVKEVIARV